jgi:putative glutamine amidotransferase
MHDIRLEATGIVPTALGVRHANVNTYHHQGVAAADLAPGLRATAWASSAAGDIVEALEGAGDRFVVGVQCHPERAEFSPPEMERLWRAFLDAARVSSAAGTGTRTASRCR